MARFDSAIALADSLIAKNGQSVTLRQIAQAAAPDADKPWKKGEATTTDTDVIGVFLNYKRRDIDGETIKEGDQYVYIAAKELEVIPATDDLIIRDSEVWKIINVEELRPNDQHILYTAQVRQ